MIYVWRIILAWNLPLFTVADEQNKCACVLPTDCVIFLIVGELVRRNNFCYHYSAVHTLLLLAVLVLMSCQFRVWLYWF